jgi:nucleoid DNA-binding protein
MQELIERVQQEAGVTPEQAKKSIEAVANFVKEKFPMMAGAVDQLFMAGGNS